MAETDVEIMDFTEYPNETSVEYEKSLRVKNLNWNGV